MRIPRWHKGLVWTVLWITVITGSFSSVALLWQGAASPVAAASSRTKLTPVKHHKVSYTSAAYYKSRHPKKQALSKPGSLPIRPPASPEKPHTSNPKVPTDFFSFSFSAPNPADATFGVPVTVCVVSDDDGAAYGEDVYLAADSGSAFLPNLVTLDVSGCGYANLYVPVVATVNVYAAINYITPAFNAWGGYDEYGEYPLPSVAATQITVIAPSTPIPGSTVFGNGNGSSPFSAEPVNLALGNYTYQHTDLTLPVRDRSILMTRSYNSQDSSFGPLGANWTFLYNQSITFPTASTASVIYSDGHHENYTVSGGIYTPVPGTGVLSSLVQNSDGSFTVTHKDQSQDNYSSAGQLISMVDRNGNALTLTYNGSGQLVGVADASGRGLTFAYDSNGDITSVTDPLGLSVQYTYDSNNNLIQVTDPLGNKTSYTYDSAHQLLTITDPLGHVVVTNTYDSSNRVIQQVNAAGSVTTFAYQPGSTTVTDPLGHSTTSTYDLFYRQTSQTDALGNVTNYSYDSNGELTTVTDGDGNTTEYTYDGLGNLLTIIDANGVAIANPVGHTTTYSYDAQNHLISQIDANSNMTSYTYDSHGNLLTVTDALGGVTTFTYDQYGEQMSSTSPDGGGHTTTNTYDSFGDQVATQDGLGNTTTTTYDADGKPVQVTDALGNTTTTTYDADGHVLSLTDALGHHTTYTYDADGNRLSITSPNGATTSYVYDVLNRLVQVNNPGGSSVSYTYDANGNKLQQTDELGHVTSYTYDADNHLLKTTDPLGHSTSSNYDGAGNIVTVTNANGQVTAYGYDANNQVIQVNYADGSSVSFTYNGVGNRLSMTDVTGTTYYSFDALNRLLSQTNAAGYTVSFGYDAASNQTSLTYPDGRTATFGYDNANRLSSVTDWAGRATSYSYDANGNLITATMPNQMTTNYSYDADNRLIGLTNTQSSQVLSAFQYTLDADGNITRVISSGAAVEVGTTSYHYDSMDRLTQANYPDSSLAIYTYDAAGNRSTLRTTLGRTTTTTSYTYNAADELLKAVSSSGTTTAYAYDNNGNLLSSGQGGLRKTYQYNAQGELARYSFGATTVNYTYNGDGFRVAKSVVTTAGTATTQYVLSPSKLPQVLEEIGATATTDDLYGLAMIDSEDSTGSIAPAYYAYDAQGNVRNVVQAGSSPSVYSYDAFGAIRHSSGVTSEFQVNGQQVDTEDGLVYLRARYYDPTLGRFIMRDQASGNDSLPQTLNRYSYVDNNPVNLMDPSGNFAILVTIGLGALIGGGSDLIAQAIAGNGINWGEVGVHAAIGAAFGGAALLLPIAGEAVAAYAAEEGVSTAAAGTLGSIAENVGSTILAGAQGSAEYCADYCGTSKFSWHDLLAKGEEDAALSVVTSGLQSALAKGVSYLASQAENEGVSQFLQRMGQYISGDSAPSWWTDLGLTKDQFKDRIGELLGVPVSALCSALSICSSEPGSGPEK
jgi:RHS repeat-associated protein